MRHVGVLKACEYKFQLHIVYCLENNGPGDKGRAQKTKESGLPATKENHAPCPRAGNTSSSTYIRYLNSATPPQRLQALVC